MELLDHHCAILGSIALPQILGCSSRVSSSGKEIQSFAYHIEVADIGIVGPPSVASWIDVLDQHGAILGSIALPQLSAVDSIVCSEKQGVANDRLVLRTHTHYSSASVNDVLDQHGAILGSIALPQLSAVDSIVGGQVEGIAEGGEMGEVLVVIGRILSRNILDHHGT